MGLPDDDRRALLARLAPAGAPAVDVLGEAVDDGEELREIVVDVQGDVVAFTDRRALFVAEGTDDVVAVGYDEVEVRRRDTGLAIDAIIEGGRLILDVARGTFVRLAVVGTGGPPGRASWLPVRAPTPRPAPEPAPTPAPALAAEPATLPPPPGGAAYTGEPGRRTPPPFPSAAGVPASPAPPTAPAAAAAAPVQHAPAPASSPPPPDPAAPAHPVPSMPPPGLPPAGWNPDPSGRHWWRWWDGMDWTDHVADGGAPFVDPLPPRL